MKTLLTAVAAVAMLASAASAQKTVQTGKGGGGSPHMKGDWTISGANIAIEYGSPFLKGRSEAQLMPPGSEWRTGADQATVITSDKTLKFGAVTLAPGSYTINTLPDAKEWKLILGKLGKPGQWGVPYLPALEIGRAPMKLGKTAAAAEQVTYHIDPTASGGTLRIEWGTTSVTSPFTVVK
ncbi:MAG: DUF2911 domain-containing protein [Gemmatimonadaceae bacterium]